MVRSERLQNRAPDVTGDFRRPSRGGRIEEGALETGFGRTCRLNLGVMAFPSPRARAPLLGLAAAAVAGIEAADLWVLPVAPLFLGCAVLLAACWLRPQTIFSLGLTAASFAAWHTVRHQQNAGRA